MSDIDTGVVDSLKALDPEWPIREADIEQASGLRWQWKTTASTMGLIIKCPRPHFRVKIFSLPWLMSKTGRTADMTPARFFHRSGGFCAINLATASPSNSSSRSSARAIASTAGHRICKIARASALQ